MRIFIRLVCGRRQRTLPMAGSVVELEYRGRGMDIRNYLNWLEGSFSCSGDFFPCCCIISLHDERMELLRVIR